MNNHDPLEKSLEQFRKTVPPEEVRDAIRRSVRASLETPAATHWWQRSITVPLPAMLATASVLLLSLSIHLMGAQGRAEPSGPNGHANPSQRADSSATTRLAWTEPQAEYSETQRYISGVGVVDRKTIYRIKE